MKGLLFIGLGLPALSIAKNRQEKGNGKYWLQNLKNVRFERIRPRSRITATSDTITKGLFLFSFNVNTFRNKIEFKALCQFD